MTTYPHDPVKSSEAWIVADGQTLAGVHLAEHCEPPCPFHAPTDHPLRQFPLRWRPDRGILERRCPHGVGHPDPDNVTTLLRLRPGDTSIGVHGCDGCCR